MAAQRKRKTGEQTGEGPYIGASDRPDLTIDLDARLGDLTVRQLSAILAPGAGSAGFWKPLKDAKDTAKDFKDGKDIIDTGSSIWKEIFERIPWPISQKLAEPGVGPRDGLGGFGGFGGLEAPGVGSSPLDQLIERISHLERAIDRLERRESKE